MKARPLISVALLAAVTGLTAPSAAAATLYTNDFDGHFSLDAGVLLDAATNGAIETARPGFGGWSGNYFVNRRTGNPADPTTLTFTNLAAHSTVSIAFLLGFLESWDSRDSGTSFGPDNLDVTIDDAQINDNMYFADTLVDMSTAPLLKFAHTSSSLIVHLRASGTGSARAVMTKRGALMPSGSPTMVVA